MEKMTMKESHRKREAGERTNKEKTGMSRETEHFHICLLVDLLVMQKYSRAAASIIS